MAAVDAVGLAVAAVAYNGGCQGGGQRPRSRAVVEGLRCSRGGCRGWRASVGCGGVRGLRGCMRAEVVPNG